jgi:hypothetical protein
MRMLFCLYRPPWKAMIAKFISWILRKGLASVVVSVMCFLVMAPLLLGYGFLPPSQSAEANHRKTETTHRKSKARYKPPSAPHWSDDTGSFFSTWTVRTRHQPIDETFANDLTSYRVDACCTVSVIHSLADVVREPIPIKARIEGLTWSQVLSMCFHALNVFWQTLKAYIFGRRGRTHRRAWRSTSMCRDALHACWQKLQDVVFGMRTRRSKRGHGSHACRSTTHYVAPSCKRGACIGRKRPSARYRWTRLLFLATVSTGPLAAHAFSSSVAKMTLQVKQRSLS